MPPAAPDYAGQADSIYNPQATSDAATLAATRDAQTAGFDTETDTANSAYTDALATAGKARDTASANDDMVAQTHGLWTSGLAANAQRLTYQNYVDNATKVATDRAAKLTDIGRRADAATQAYASNYGALQSKYAGLKSTYIIDHQNADATAAASNAAKVEAAQIKASAAAGKAPAGYGVTTPSGGGVQFHGPDGQPITAAQYAQALGTTVSSVLGGASDAGTQQVTKDINSGMSAADLAKKYPYVFGGV